MPVPTDPRRPAIVRTRARTRPAPATCVPAGWSERQVRAAVLTALAEPVCLADPLRRLVRVTPPGGQEQHDNRVDRGPDLIAHLAGRFSGRDDQRNAFGPWPPSPGTSSARREPHRRVRLAGRERATHPRTDVVVLDLERGEPFQLLGAAQMRLRGFGEPR